MLTGFRLLIAAACGVAIIISLGVGAYFGSLYGPETKLYQTAHASDLRGQDYSGPSESLPDIAGLPSAVERLVANPSPTTGVDHEKRDLAAQEATAMWAFWMVIVSCFSACITTIGTLLLYRQITLTRAAVIDTSEATKAIIRQNEIAEAAQRAWISIHVGAIEKIEVIEPGIQVWAEITLKNQGNTLANDMWVIVEPWDLNSGKHFNTGAKILEYKQSIKNRDSEAMRLHPGDFLGPGEERIAQYQRTINKIDLCPREIWGECIVSPHIFVCVIYRSADLSAVYHTSRTFSTYDLFDYEDLMRAPKVEIPVRNWSGQGGAA